MKNHNLEDATIKALNESFDLAKSKIEEAKEQDNWFGVKGAKYIYRGDWNDPVVSYRGYIYNYWDITDFVYNCMADDYREEGKELPEENSKEYDDLFNKYMEDEVESALYDLYPQELDPQVMEFLKNGRVSSSLVDLIKNANAISDAMTFEGLLNRLNSLKEITDIPEDKIDDAINTTQEFADRVDYDDPYDEDEVYGEVMPIIEEILSNLDNLYESKQIKKETRIVEPSNKAEEIAEAHFTKEDFEDFVSLGKEDQFKKIFDYLTSVEYDFCTDDMVKGFEKGENTFDDVITCMDNTIAEIESLKDVYPDKINNIDDGIEKFKKAKSDFESKNKKDESKEIKKEADESLVNDYRIVSLMGDKKIMLNKKHSTQDFQKAMRDAYKKVKDNLKDTDNEVEVVLANVDPSFDWLDLENVNESKEVKTEDFWTSKMLTWEEWLEAEFEHEVNTAAQNDTAYDNIDELSPEEIEKLDADLYDNVRVAMENREDDLKKLYQEYVQKYIDNAEDYIKQLKANKK